MKKTIILLITSFFIGQLSAMNDQNSDSKPHVVNVESIYGSTCYVTYSDGTKRFEVRSGNYICPLDTFLIGRIQATKNARQSIDKKD